MATLVITAAGLGKKYYLGRDLQAGARYRTLRDTLADGARRVFRKGSLGKVETEEFWALRNINFEIQQGEVVGIIGRNGAGKSTLLKVLSRITEPTAGVVRINGRVASLLEVGTGFHPELTGRENIFLNGAILGMTRAEIKSKFDEIVEFADIERFLDTPVKRFSSGMYVRLAFAVAAHLEPEILIVDEVLAVGDAQFQKKCLGKMGEVAKTGRTVLFVSHQMRAVTTLCERAILLSGGQIEFDGKPDKAANIYLEETLSTALTGISLKDRIDRAGNGKIRLTYFRMEDVEGRPLASLRSGRDVVFVFGYESGGSQELRNVDVGFSFDTELKESLFGLYSSYVGQTFEKLPSKGSFRCVVRKLAVAPGRYSVAARVTVGGEEADFPHDGIGFANVEAGDFYGTGSEGYRGKTYLLVTGNWSVSPQTGAEHPQKSNFGQAMVTGP